MALPAKSSGTGRALGGGATKAPNPFSVWLGATIARACLFCALPPSATTVVPDSATTRLSISTNEPDNGRSDQRVSPVTWNSTIKPLSRRAAVTRGVPSASVAQVLLPSVASGSASTCRVTVTSFGTGIPLNGLSRENAASGCGWSQLKLPPRMRPPRRNLTGTSSSSDAASRGPANRTKTPPSSTHRARRSCASPTLPTSVRIRIGRF